MRFILLCLFNLLCIANTQAEPLKVVYHINELEKTQILINSINATLSANVESEVKVIFQGSAIIRLATDSDINTDVRALIRKGVSFGACSISIINKNLSELRLIEGVEIIGEGGVVRILQLQKQGYGYIKI